MNTTQSKTPTLLAALLLIVLNTVAIGGQAAWFAERVTHDNMVFAVAIAAVIELIGVFLSSMAHARAMANQSLGSTRAGSYVIGILAGILNYWHWHGAAGVTFGVLSMLSPYLWSIWSQYRHRQKLAELGMVDARGLRLSTVRKVMHPIKSFKLVRFAAWEGITDVAEARQAWEIGNKIDELMPEPVSGIPLTTVDAELDRKAAVVNRAKAIKAITGSWSAAAGELGISNRTLFNYRQEVQDAD